MKEQIREIIEEEWEALESMLFSAPIEAEVAAMVDRILTRVDELPTIIDHYAMMEIGTRPLRFTVRPGPGSMEEVVRLNLEVGRVFIFTGASGDADEMNLTFTPGNGVAAVMTYDPQPIRGWLRRWWDRMTKGEKR